MYVRYGVIKLLVVSVFTLLGVTGDEKYTEITEITEPTEITEIPEISEITEINEGSEIKLEEFPYQVSLHFSYNGAFFCGGSIISSKMVLTAAHCMYYNWGGLLPPLIITVSAGKKNLNQYALESFGVESVRLHPNFNKTKMGNNLALIEIKGEFPFNNLIRKVSLERRLPEAKYNNCVVTGWDKNSHDFEVLEVGLTDCENFPRSICTKKSNEKEVCISDAGNPLVCDGNLIGVLSVEPNCEDPSQLTIFENIRHSLSWLDEHGVSSASIMKICDLFLLIVLNIVIYMIL